MKLQEGPALSALIIGAGIGFLVFQKSQKLPLAIAIGLAVGVADYALLVLVKRFSNKG